MTSLCLVCQGSGAGPIDYWGEGKGRGDHKGRCRACGGSGRTTRDTLRFRCRAWIHLTGRTALFRDVWH
jgi:hypothetical protein